MSSCQLPIARMLLGLSLSLCVWCAGAQEHEAIFRAAQRQGSPASAVATVVEPAGGQFVYSSERTAMRPTTRFAIGKAPQTDYAIFSAEEQHELDLLRDHAALAQESNESPIPHPHANARSSGQSNATRRAARASACQPSSKVDHVAGLAWPKVVQEGETVCVPKLDFAEQPDWRDHVWCFNKGDGSVR